MGNWNDGGVPFGSRRIKLYNAAGASDASGATNWSGGTAVGPLILESFSPTRPQFTAERYDEARTPNGAIGKDDFQKASAVVQLPYEASVMVDTGFAFTSLRKGGTVEVQTWIAEGVDEPESNGEIRKQSVRFRKAVATPSANIPPQFP